MISEDGFVKAVVGATIGAVLFEAVIDGLLGREPWGRSGRFYAQDREALLREYRENREDRYWGLSE